MITRASRKERANMSGAAGTGYTVPAYTVTTNRSFVLTDLIFSTNDPGESARIYDNLSQASPTAAQTKMYLAGNPYIITNLANGPEFTTGVSIELVANRAAPTYCLWVGGFER